MTRCFALVLACTLPLPLAVNIARNTLASTDRPVSAKPAPRRPDGVQADNRPVRSAPPTRQAPAVPTARLVPSGAGAEGALALLSALPPLPRVHYTAPVSGETLEENQPEVTQLIRITGALTIDPMDAGPAAVRRALSMCAAHEAELALLSSPFAALPDETAPTDGPAVRRAVARLRGALEAVRRAWSRHQAASREIDRRPAELRSVLLYCTRWRVDPEDDRHNDALGALHAGTYRAVKDVFPDVDVHWFARGARAWHPVSRWRKSPYFTGHEPGDSVSAGVDRVPWVVCGLETVDRLAGFSAQPMGLWIALGAGRKPLPEALLDAPFRKRWDYPALYSYLIGRALHDPGISHVSYAHLDNVDYVVLRPQPLDPAAPHALAHFAAYVRGAAAR